MPQKYNPVEIEKKWQKRWVDTGLYETHEDPSRPKHYALTMLPYTSGDLHIGHWYAMSPSDTKARYKRMNGYNVFFPIGFDAFGLPAENAAINHGIHPAKWTLDNVDRMRGQLRSMGAMWAWDREAVTCLPGFYKWTEWFFLKFYEHGLAYRSRSPVDFCPNCNTTLAREQVWGEDRHCERCNTPVIKKDLEQWFFRITNYAQELLDDMERIDWPEPVKIMQRNWIGRSEGARVVFRSEQDDPIEVFTTRPDTLWGATFMVLAPEHPLVGKLTAPECRQAVDDYIAQAARQSEIERLATDKEKTGVFIGAHAVNPANQARIPIWIADYVLMAYGTGAIMAVPSHDERDFAFSIKFGMPIIPVIKRIDGRAKSLIWPGAVQGDMAADLDAAGIGHEQTDEGIGVTLQGQKQIDAYVALLQGRVAADHWVEVVGADWLFVFSDQVMAFDSVTSDQAILARCKTLAANWPQPSETVAACRSTMELLASKAWYADTLFHAEYGDMINSQAFTGTPGAEAKATVTHYLEEQSIGHDEVNFRLHDWLISRQRMWGAPIPMIYCDECGIVPVPYEELPVLLPDDAEFLPTGESPLLHHAGFLNTTCPKCGGPARRETDTMDTFMCSSWYHMAYVSPYYEGDVPIDPEKANYWLPVDQYTGGIEHATMHLLYTRFFTKACRDIGLFDFDEPMDALFTQGMILGEDNEKMSKSRGNVVNPDDYVSTLGADSVRAFLMFIGPWELGGSWSSTGIEGIYRFVNRVWSLVIDEGPTPTKAPSAKEVADLRRQTHQTIAAVTRDFEAFKFNTALASMMKLCNTMTKARSTAVYRSEAWGEAIRTMILLLAPIMPHVTEELWERIGGEYSVHTQAWPICDEALAADKEIEMVVQVNGRVRARLTVPADIAKDDALAKALADENVQRHTEGKKIVKQIYVPGKLVNLVIR